jgi:hypothetical protein
MAKRVTHARGADGQSLCGRGASFVAIFAGPTCKRCTKLVALQNGTYVEHAKQLLASAEVISAGQVAFRVHGRQTRIEHNEAADFALMASTDFRRASFLGASRFREVYLWRQS